MPYYCPTVILNLLSLHMKECRGRSLTQFNERVYVVITSIPPEEHAISALSEDYEI